MKKKIKKQKNKKIVNAEELNAMKQAYGQSLDKRDYFKYVFIPAVLSFGFTFLLFYYLWIPLLIGILGAYVGAKKILPSMVKKMYNQKVFLETNKFINNLTQVLTDDKYTLVTAINLVNNRASGEFQSDIRIFQAAITGADNNLARKAFNNLSEKYKDDLIFNQYLEQLETSYIEGRINVETLKDIKTYHNDLKKKKDLFERSKNKHLSDMKMIMGIIVVFIISITFSFGYDTYIDGFAHHFIGWITISVFLLFLINFSKSYINYFFDDSVTEVKF